MSRQGVVAVGSRGLSHVTRPSLGAACFAVALVVYLVTRLVGLTDYPISFIGDEAVQVVDAGQLVHHGLRDQFGDLLPTYLRNGPYLNLSTTVYLQLVPYRVFGYSEFAARGVTVLMTLSGAIAISLLLRDVFRSRFWWVGALLLSIVPAWFLHSRTALEAPTGCSFYCWFLYLYFRARTTGSARSLYAAVALGALTFYSYAPLKIVVVATALLFCFSDIRWLNERRSVLLRAIGIGALLALPELRFQLAHSGANLDQLHVLGSYVVDPRLSLTEKLGRFAHQYALGLDPRYWYNPGESRDLSRHVMKGWGNLLPGSLPFAALGVARVLSCLRTSSYRAILLATVAAPLGAATVEIQLPRSLVIVVPATILTALGLDWILTPLAARLRFGVVSVAVLAILTAVNVVMLVDALRNAPTWYHDYGLYGLQYGARQVSQTVRRELRRHPEDSIAISSAWANGTDTLIDFFLPNEPRVRVETLETTLLERTDRYPDLARTIFVVTPTDLGQVRVSRLFEEPNVFSTLELPDGQAGFDFIRLRYSARAPAIIAAERARLHHPVTEAVVVGGGLAEVTHTPFDFGDVSNLFDGDPFTLARTADASSMEFRLEFSAPRPLRSVRVVGRDMTLATDIRVDISGRGRPLVFHLVGVRRESQPTLEITLGPRPQRVRSVELRIFDPTDPATRHVHVREIDVR
jgi:hypothetical protein